MTILKQNPTVCGCVFLNATAYAKVIKIIRRLEVLGNICVQPPLAADKNEFFFDWGAIDSPELWRFFRLFPASCCTISSPPTLTPSNSFDELRRGRGATTFPFITPPLPE